MPDFLEPRLQFRADGPFYGLVVCYLCQVHGFNEIASRGIRAQMQQLLDAEALRGMLDAFEDEPTREAARKIASGGITGLLAESALHSEVAARVEVSIERLASSVVSNHRAAIPHLNRLSAGALLIVAWETTEAVHTKDPDWEFLRHCRNAAAHDGRFSFRRGEPTRPAHWRGLEIVSALQGRRLLNDGAPGFIGPGDCLHLLSDLEAKYF